MIESIFIMPGEKTMIRGGRRGEHVFGPFAGRVPQQVVQGHACWNHIMEHPHARPPDDALARRAQTAYELHLIAARGRCRGGPKRRIEAQMADGRRSKRHVRTPDILIVR